jgi:hypothetical protein
MDKRTHLYVNKRSAMHKEAYVEEIVFAMGLVLAMWGSMRCQTCTRCGRTLRQ